MPKQITMLVLGSRGDVQPFVALGAGLKAAGYGVCIVASRVFEPMIRAHGLDYAPIRFDPQQELKKPEVQSLLREGFMLFRLREVIRFSEHLYRELFDDYYAATEGADVLIASSVAYNALECAEKRGIPVISAHLAPLSPTREFSNFFLTGARNLGVLNRPSHHLLEFVSWQSVRSALNGWRRERLNLPPLPFLSSTYQRFRSGKMPTLYAFSPSFIPRPADWGEREVVTGYWFLDGASEYIPPDDLARFLADGSPPVSIGFGSMSDDKPERLRDLAVEALRLAGQRGVLLSGWTGLAAEGLPDSIYPMDSAPHDWLFPQMAAVVHHGGAGTTGASLRSGVPTIITPFLLDQFGWAYTVQQRGLGPKAAPINKLMVERLAEAIQTAVSDTAMRERAAAMGAKIRAEDGVGTAVRVIQQAIG